MQRRGFFGVVVNPVRFTAVRIVVIAIAATFGFAVFCLKERASSIQITNTGPGFQVLSVRITKGTNAAIYYPNRWRYAQMQTEAGLHKIVPSYKAHYGYAFKLQDWHAADFTCWIEFRSADDPGWAIHSAKARIERAGLASDWIRSPDRNTVHNIVTHRGILF